MVMGKRRNVAEGAEKPYDEDDYISVKRGGMQVGYFFNYPNAIGSGSFSIKETE